MRLTRKTSFKVALKYWDDTSGEVELLTLPENTTFFFDFDRGSYFVLLWSHRGYYLYQERS